MPTGEEGELNDKARNLPKQIFEYLIAYLVSENGTGEVVNYILQNFDELMNCKIKFTKDK